ncbi:hypothetical protein R1flu_022373 [Riccia fluitans]|uniref:Uncharacterized protein n=1 Tax=Riccia fluitans TaxID=41844 RepID=A0ABD1ZSX6_9MARC
MPVMFLVVIVVVMVWLIIVVMASGIACGGHGVEDSGCNGGSYVWQMVFIVLLLLIAMRLLLLAVWRLLVAYGH